MNKVGKTGDLCFNECVSMNFIDPIKYNIEFDLPRNLYKVLFLHHSVGLKFHFKQNTMYYSEAKYVLINKFKFAVQARKKYVDLVEY